MKKKTLIIIIVVILLAILAGVAVIFLTRENSANNSKEDVNSNSQSKINEENIANNTSNTYYTNSTNTTNTINSLNDTSIQNETIESNPISNNSAKIKIFEEDIVDYSVSVKKEITVNVGDTIELSEYEGNDIKILEINDDSVKISRDATKYDVVDENTYNYRSYKETVEDVFSYGERIQININGIAPGAPLEQARYTYFVQFEK